VPKTMTKVCWNCRLPPACALCVVLPFLTGCQKGSRAEPPVKTSLCELRDKPESFAGKKIQTAGWIYTDAENFSLDNGRCGINLEGLAETDTRRADRRWRDFEQMLATSKNGSFNSDHQVFAVIRGSFRGSSRRLPNGSQAEPSIISIDQIMCSTVAPIKTNSEETAESKCYQ